MFWEYLISYLIDLELNNCSEESVGSGKLVKGTVRMSELDADVSLEIYSVYIQ